MEEVKRMLEPDFEKGIEILNSILFCSHTEKLKSYKSAMESFLLELKETIKTNSSHKEKVIEFIQDILMAYHEKEKSLELKKREMNFHKFMKWMGAILVIVILGMAVLVFKFTQKTQKDTLFTDNGNFALDLPLKDRLNLLEEKLQNLLRDNDKILVLIKNFKADLEKNDAKIQVLLKDKELSQSLKKDFEKYVSRNNDELFKLKERLTYNEDLIREIRTQRIFTK